MKRDADAVIIGAGALGAATALELARRGYKTTVVDKLPAAGYGPTSNSCAIVRFHYSSREGVTMAYEGEFYWRDWPSYLGVEDEMGMARYINSGVVLIKSQLRQHEKSVPHYDALGIQFEEWDAETLGEKLPQCDTHQHWPPRRPNDPQFRQHSSAPLEGAVYTPGGGYVDDPQLATHNLQRAAESLGTEFLFGSEVVRVSGSNGRVAGVRLASGDQIAAPVVVNVAGPHSFVVNQMAGVEGGMNIKTRALRHEVHHVPAPSSWKNGSHGYVVSDPDLGIYFRPAGADHILVGSEDPKCDDRQWIDDPSHFDRAVTEAQWEAQVYRLALRVPSLPIPHARKGIVDLYDVSDDWIPIYDRSDLPGFYMAIGTSGNQFKNAPVVGHLMAELIDQVERGADHDHDPVKVTSRYSGETLDVGFYSRLRTINENSSFSVSG